MNLIDEKGNSSKLSFSGFLVGFVVIAILLLGISWLLFDESLSDSIDRWISTEEVHTLAYALLAILILALDLILPIPSSAVISHAGILLGIVGGTIIGFLGLTIGSLTGFALTRWLGQRYVSQRVSPTEIDQLQQLTEKFGAFVVVILRPVPIFAEASVLLLGLGGMSIRSFLIWLSISNLFVALMFAWLGTWAQQQRLSESVTILISMAIPVVLLVLVKIAFPFVTATNTNRVANNDDNPERPL